MVGEEIKTYSQMSSIVRDEHLTQARSMRLICGTSAVSSEKVKLLVLRL